MKTQSRAAGERLSPSVRVDEAPADAPEMRTGTLPVRETRRPADTLTEAPAPAGPLVGREASPRRGPQSWLTLENGLYLLFLILAVGTRFWDVGAKGLHHDESLHAVYSWKYYMDQGYIHSPMMHGPEQFHFIDLFYLLFGATDATARFASATCGVFLVMAPWFLRRQLGRWPALIATFLFLISPAFMYFTRFAREDAIYAAMEMVFVLGLWRFVDERKPRDFYVLCAGYSLMFTIKESAYLTTAVIGLLLVGLFAWQTGRLLFSTLLGYLALAGGLALVILRLPSTPKLPNIPDQDPSPEKIQGFVTGLIGHPLIQVMAGMTLLWVAVWAYLLWDQSRRVRQSAAAAPAPAPIAADDDGMYTAYTPAYTPADETATNGHTLEEANGADGNGVPATVVATEADNGLPPVEVTTYAPAGTTVLSDGEAVEVEDGAGDSEGEPAPAPVPVAAAPRPRPAVVAPDAPGLLERYQPGSLPYAVGYLVRHPAVFGTGVAVAVLLFVALYTSLFTNINGIGTGLFGSIGYWLAQQDVRRGDQPWFYYFILIPIYEPLTIFFGFVGMLYFAWQGFRSLLANQRTAALLYALSIVFLPVALPIFLIAMLVRAFRSPTAAPVVPGATAGFNVGKPVEFAEFRPFVVLFCSFWFLGAIGLYSWAGEKMPWLQTHIVHPLIFLAALGLGQLVKSMIRNRRRRAVAYDATLYEDAPVQPARRGSAARLANPPAPALTPWEILARPTSWVPFLTFLSLFVLVSIFWAMNISHRVMNNDYNNWWQLLIWPALLLLIVAGYWSVVGGPRVLRYTLVAILLLLSGYGIRSAVQLSFYHAMDAREMAVYVQTSPDVTRAADTIDRLSVDQTGGREMKVVYDSLASWPWEWYFRDYKNKQFLSGGPTSAPDPGVAVLVIDSAWYDKAKSGQAPQLDNYVGNKYPMRWWFPEDTYRNFVPSTWDELDPAQPYKPDGTPNFLLVDGKQVKAPLRQIQGALDTILYTLKTPSEQGKVWKYLMYREPYAPLGSTDFAVFVRKDLVERYNYLATLDLPNYDSMLSR